MRRFAPSIRLPLVTKELIEQSARRRTYILRSAYACVLFLVACWMFDDILTSFEGDAFAILGHGRRMFEQLVFIQMLGIYLFMPGMVCGAISHEKERNCLSLLLITRLSPRTILFEKLLGRLVPMFMFLLLSMPLMAFTYSLGGISVVELWCASWVLALTCVQVASFTLMCSAYCSTTVSAFIATYLLGLPCFVLFSCGGAIMSLSGNIFELGATIFLTIELVFSSFIFLAFAQAFLVERALIPPRNVGVEIFRALDEFFTELNNLTTGGIVLVKEKATLPGDAPIAWRETSKKSLGRARYLIRVLLAIETPLLIILATSGAVGSPRSGVAAALLFLVWTIAVLMVTAKSASLVSSERTHQTLEVLLSTPLRSRDIIQQSFSGVHRLIAVLCVPFVTIFVFEAWWQWSYATSYDDWIALWKYLVCSALSVAVYIPLVAWMSLWIGLKVRSQARAIILSLAAVLGWMFLPLVISDAAWTFGLRPLTFFCPSAIVVLNESRQVDWITILMNFVLYGTILFFVRKGCLDRAGRYLGRGDEESTFDELEPAGEPLAKQEMSAV